MHYHIFDINPKTGDYAAINKINYDYAAGDDQDDENDDSQAQDFQSKILRGIRPADYDLPDLSHVEPDETTTNDDENSGEHFMFKRNAGRRTDDVDGNIIRYQWFRNSKLIKEETGKRFQVFENGTLKIAFSSLATGHFRCMASVPGLGRIMSKGCYAQQASKFFAFTFFFG